MKIFRLIFKELMTPSNQVGPAAFAYMRSAEGVWHIIAGNAAISLLMLAVVYFGLALPYLIGVLIIGSLYSIKEYMDLKNGGRKNDSFEDVFMVVLGAILHNIPFFSVIVLLVGMLTFLLHMIF